MENAERKEKKLLNLPTLPNWVRNNRRRFDETVFELRRFLQNPPRHRLARVNSLCARLACRQIRHAEAWEEVESLGNPVSRQSGREVLPAFERFLAATRVEGLPEFSGFRITYPIGIAPDGSTLSIPITPTFVGIVKDRLTPVFLISWAQLSFNEYQKALISSVIVDAVLSHQDFIDSDALVLALPRVPQEKVRYERLWGARDYATLDHEGLSLQFDTYSRAVARVIAELRTSVGE